MAQRRRPRLWRAALLATVAGAVTVTSAASPPAGAEGTPFTLDIIHINDHHSRLAADTVTLNIGGGRATIQRGGFPRVVAAIDQLRTTLGPSANVATVHAGDAITGSLFYTLFKGEADAAMMNQACFDVFAIGNHEFDASDQGLVDFLDDLRGGACPPEVISANITVADGTPLAEDSGVDYFKPYVVKDYGTEQVGFIGITIAQKTKVSSSPLETTQFADEVETMQANIDLLTAQGVDKIIGVTHYGYGNDLAMVAELTGIDAVVGGDSHSLLGDFSAYGLASEGPYPTQVTDADGKPVCVVQAWQYSHVVGHLTVDFDENGDVTTCSGTPYLMLGNVNTVANGATAESVAAAIAADPRLWQVTPDPDAVNALKIFEDQVSALSAQVIGQVSAPIRNTRFPSNALPNGGEAAQLVTEAVLAKSARAQIALQNSGGVRIDLPAGNLTIGQVYTLLPFGNTLYELELTGAQIKLALEQGVGNVLDNAGSTGAYPYGAGIRWDLDASQAFGSRFTNVEVKPRGTTEWVPLADTDVFIVAVNSFMATGGDGYTVLRTAVNAGKGVDTFIPDAQSFVDFVQEQPGGAISPPTEFSTRSFIPRVVPPAPTAVTGVAGARSAQVSWTAPGGGTIFQPVTSYTVTASPGGATCTTPVATPPATTCTVTGLASSTAYTFTVTATNAKGTSSSSTASAGVTPTKTVPLPPTGVTAVKGNAAATVSWTAPADDGGEAITGYTVTASPGGATCTTTGATTCDVTGLTNGTAYTFTVTATNTIGTSAASAASSAVTPSTVPGAPTSVELSLGDEQVGVSWTAPADNGGSAITGYTVTVTPGGATCSTTGATTCTVTGLTNGVDYSLQVVATNVNGDSEPSSPSPFMLAVVPDAPTAVTAVAGNAQAVVSWTAPADDGGASITGYRVTSEPGGLECTTSGAPAPTTCTVTGLTNGTAYTFTVVAINDVGDSLESSPSAAVTPSTVPGAPSRPTGVAGDRRVTLSWSAPSSNGGASITDYTVQYRLVGAASWTTFTDGVRATTGAVVTGLDNGKRYEFRVAAVNVRGTGTASAVSTPVRPIGRPAAPGRPVGTAGDRSVRLTWTAPTSNGGSAITDYVVQFRVVGAPSWRTFDDGVRTRTNATVTGLRNGTRYEFRVSAVNAVGGGAPSLVSAPVRPRS